MKYKGTNTCGLDTQYISKNTITNTNTNTNTNSVCVCVCFGAACGDMLIGSGYSIASLTIAEITEKGINP